MSADSPPSIIPDSPVISTSHYPNTLDPRVTVRQGNRVPKQLSRSSDNVIVEYTGNLVRKLTVLKELPERPPVPVVPKRKTVVKSTKLVTTPSPSFRDVTDVQIKKKVPKSFKKPPEKFENKIDMDSEMETLEIHETQEFIGATALQFDAGASSVSINSTNINPASPTYSREQKAELVKQQRQKRFKEKTEERLKKKAENENKKQKLAELREKQLKIVQNNVRKARLKQQKEKTEVPKSPEERQQEANEISVPKLELFIPEYLRKEIEIPDFLSQDVNEQPMEEGIVSTQGTKSPIVIRLDEVIQPKQRGPEEFYYMTPHINKGKKDQILLKENKDTCFTADDAAISAAKPVSIKKLQETSEVDKFEAMHPNVTQRVHGSLDAVDQLTFHDIMSTGVTEPAIEESLLPHADQNENLEPSKENFIPIEFPEDPLVTKIKNTLKEINLMRSSGSPNDNAIIIPHTATSIDYNKTDNFVNVDVVKAVNEAMETRKKQEAAAAKIQAAFRQYRAKKLKKVPDKNTKKYIFFKNSEPKPETKTPSVGRPLNAKRAADKNWKAAKYPSPPKTRKENESQSDWLKPTYVKPCGYNMMTAIENTIKSRSKATQPYWCQANRENINKSLDTNKEHAQAIPVIDASKSKPKKRMTVGQFLRASEMSKEVLQSYLVSDEESSRAEADVSAISTAAESSTSSDESRVKWRKQVNLKLQEVLPDRVTPRWWSKSETQIRDKFSSLKSRKKLFVHTSKENARPITSAETISQMYSAVTPKKLKQKHYGLVVPNVELRRRNERTRYLQEKYMSDTNTWNSHVTYRQSVESDRRNETTKGMPVDFSCQADDPATWESHTTLKRRASEVEFHPQSEFKRRTEVSDRNQVLSHKSPVSKHKIKHDIPKDEIEDTKQIGNKHKVDDERSKLQKEEKLPSSLMHSLRRTAKVVERERSKHLRDISNEKGTTMGESSLPEKGADETFAHGTMLHPSALHLQFQAEMNRLESIEECRRHLTAIQSLFTENMKAKKKSSSGEDKQIEVKPQTIESSAQTTDLIDSNLVVPQVQRGIEVNYQSDTQIQSSDTNKQFLAFGDAAGTLNANKIENFTQTEVLRDTRLGVGIDLTSQKKNVFHGANEDSANPSDQRLCFNRFQNAVDSYTQTQITDEGAMAQHTEDSHGVCKEVTLRDRTSLQNTQNVTRRPINVAELLQESHQTRQMIAHAMNMEDLERSIRRDDELAELNRKFKMWDIEHLKQMNKMASEDNWLFQRTVLGGSSVWSTQTLVHSRILPSDRIVELEQEGDNMTQARMHDTAGRSSVPRDHGRHTQPRSVQSILQQKLRGKFENINLSRGSDAGPSVAPLVVTTEEARDLNVGSDITSNFSFQATSDSLSEEVTYAKDKNVPDVDSSVSHFSDASSTSLDKKDKLSRILDSLQKIDKLIHEEKENAKKQVLLLNEKFLHLREKTKMEIKLFRMKMRELKGRGQENLISALKEKRNSLLQNLEDAKKRNLQEHDEICRATAKRKKALRQQKAIIQSYLKIIQSCRSSITEDQNNDNLNASEDLPNISSATHREDLSNLTSELEKELKPVSKSESLQLPESATQDERNISGEADESNLSDTSPRQFHKSTEVSDEFEGIEHSPHREPVPEICDLEDRVKILKEHLQKKKNDADMLWKEQQQKKKEKLRIKESRLLKRIQAYDDYIDKLKRELEDSNSSALDVTLLSEHLTQEANSVSASRKKLLEDVDHSYVTSSKDLTSKQTIPKVHQYDSDEFYSSRQTEELSNLQQIEQSTSKGLNSDTSLKSITVKRYKIKDTDEISLKNDSEILSEIAEVENVEKTAAGEGEEEEKSEILDIQEKSEVISEIDEFEEQSEVATEMEENSEVVTELEEKYEVTTVEEKSGMETEEQQNSAVVTEVEEETEVTTNIQGSNEGLTEAEQESLVLTQIEEKSQTITDKSETILQPLEGSHLIAKQEENSHVITEIDDRQESIIDSEENVQIITEDEHYESNTKTEEKSVPDTEQEEKSEINSEIEEVEFTGEEEQENSEIITDAEEHSSYGGKQSEIVAESDEKENEDDFEMKLTVGSEIIPETGEISEILSEKEMSKILSEALAMQEDSMGVVSEANKTLEKPEDDGLNMLNATFVIETDKNEKTDIEELIETKNDNIESAEETEQKEKLPFTSLILQDSRAEDPDGTKSYSKHLHEDKFEKNEEEESILEKSSYISSAEEHSEGKIKSSKDKSLHIRGQLDSIHSKSEGKIIASGPLEIPEHTEKGEHDEVKKLEENVDKTEDTSSDIISNIMEEVSERSDKIYDASESESIKRRKMFSEKADRITDAILKKILSESLTSLCKTPAEIVSDDIDTENSGITGDVDENRRNLELHKALTNEIEDTNNNVNNLINNTEKVENITNMIFDELLRDSAKIAYETKNKLMYSKIVGDSSSENNSTESGTSDSADKGITPDVASKPHIETDVRKRIHEIMTETASTISREKKRPQDFMVTTYDVLSPEESPSDSPQPDSHSQLEDVTLAPTDELNIDKKVEEKLSVGEDQPGGDGFTQEWFDDDFGLSTTKREAEELRLQQLQIEQEIQELEQAQEELPYFYFREIPNKPPPPYTPPGQTPVAPASSTETRQEEESQIIPCTSDEITTFTLQVTDYLYNIVTTGGDVSNSQVPPDFYEETASSAASDNKESSRRIFKKLIFDLTKDFVKEALDLEEEHSSLPWEWSSNLSKRKKSPPHSKEMLREIVKRKVLEHFDSILKSPKEKPITRWSRKKQDFVDEILVKESHNEESDWTNYEEDEMAVKNDITKKILDKLMDETVQLLSCILKKKCGNLLTAAL